MNKLAIITSHPIQYNAPLFRQLAQNSNIKLRVFYTLGKDSSEFIDPGFNKAIKWDIPLLDGYDHVFVNNTSSKPSTSSFKGIVNPTLIKEIENFGATHLLVYGWSFYSHLSVLRYFHKKVKILFRGDSTLLNEKPGVRALARRTVLTWVYKHIDFALYVGQNNKKYYLKHGVPEHKLLFAPHAIDNDRFSSVEHDIEVLKLKQKLNLDAEKKIFLFTGKFDLKKNPKLLIDAFKRIDSSDSILIMVGNGVLEDEIKKLSLGSSNIKFLPFQNQSMMPVVYRLGDVLVLPSISETWGLCLNEAMASGLAVIASNKVGGAIDLIDDGKNGYIVESDNPEHLTNILQLVSDLPKQQIKQMGKLSNLKVSSWNYGQTCAAIINLLSN